MLTTTPTVRRRRSRLLLGAAFVVVLLAVVLAGRAILRSRRVGVELTRIRAASEPMTPEDLARLAGVPPGENDVTGLWQQALAAFEGRAYWQAVRALSLDRQPYLSRYEALPAVGGPWPEREAVERLLAQYAETLRLLHDAAQAGGEACYLTDFRTGYGTLLSHAQNLRVACGLLRLEAHAGALHGDARGAATALRAILGAARSLSREPCTVSQMVRVACDHMATEEIEQLLPAVRFSDAEFAEFQADLRLARYEEGMYRAMLGERVMGLTAFQNPATAGAGGVSGFLWQVWVRDDVADYLPAMREMVAAAKLDWAEATLRTERFVEPDRSNQRLSRSPLAALWLLRPSSTIGRLGEAIDHLARGTALNRAADAAIGAERYRRRTGKFPQRLEELVPEFTCEVPADPFLGGPLHYRVEDNGFVVYSVGSDRRDDGGVEKGGTWDNRGKPDVVFRVRLRSETAVRAAGQ